MTLWNVPAEGLQKLAGHPRGSREGLSRSVVGLELPLAQPRRRIADRVARALGKSC